MKKEKLDDESKESSTSSDASSCTDTVILDQDSDEDYAGGKSGRPHNEDVDCLDEASKSDSDSMSTETNPEVCKDAMI